MRRQSLPLRLDRLVGVRASIDLERTVAELVAETGLEPAEIRAELAEVGERMRRFGPGTAEAAIRRLAEEYGLPEEELWGEYERTIGTPGARR